LKVGGLERTRGREETSSSSIHNRTTAPTNMVKNYYKILEIEKSSTDADIRNAYRRLARQWHPDKNRDKQAEAEEKFKEIAEAYQVLTSNKTRTAYDTASTHEDNGPTQSDFTYEFETYTSEFRTADDLFRDVFGNRSVDEILQDLITDPDLRKIAGFGPKQIAIASETFSSEISLSTRHPDSENSFLKFLRRFFAGCVPVPAAVESTDL